MISILHLSKGYESVKEVVSYDISFLGLYQNTSTEVYLGVFYIRIRVSVVL